MLASWFYYWSEQKAKAGKVSTRPFGIWGGLQTEPRCMLIRIQILRQQIVKYAVKDLLEKD